jgi:hypothetical protein
VNLTPDEARSLATVNASFALDADRWKLSYTQHTATALQRRAHAAQTPQPVRHADDEARAIRDGAAQGAGRSVPRGLQATRERER